MLRRFAVAVFDCGHDACDPSFEHRLDIAAPKRVPAAIDWRRFRLIYSV